MLIFRCLPTTILKQKNMAFSVFNYELCLQGIHKRIVRFQKLIKMYFSPYKDITYTVINGNCPKFSCDTSSFHLMLTAGPRDQFARWSRSRRRLSMCFVLRCPDLVLKRSVSFKHGLKMALLLCGVRF
jgi:hypothetical protein